MSKFVTLHGFGGSGGGAELNFEVVASTTEPMNPNENTIWVNTDSINNYYFSATQPENMIDYDVWFHIDTSSTIEFNALKENAIQIYPISAQQYINGTLVMKVAYLQQNGEWMQFSWEKLYLYRNGDQCVSLTGGWEKKAYVSGSGMTVTFESSRIKLYSSSSASTIVIGCKNIEPNILKNFKTMYVSGTRSSGEFGFGIAYDYDIEDIDNTSDIIVYKKVASSGTYSVDISDIDSGYPVLHAYHGTSYITEIWLE